MIYSSSKVCQQDISNQFSFYRVSGIPEFLNFVILNYELYHIFNFANSVCRKSLRRIEWTRCAHLQLKVSQIADWWLKLMTSNLQSLTSGLLEAWKEYVLNENVWEQKFIFMWACEVKKVGSVFFICPYIATPSFSNILSLGASNLSIRCRQSWLLEFKFSNAATSTPVLILTGIYF